ncbi:DUF6236 family protein [Vogesella indigofera]|uniref:DUF6236 family protein n=1 Tax=Vogesella indigofera TaxID=45465 RepID=UPI00234FB3DF|nr:DUF6236 family protein [Vogesella indigofera]MDC7700189.1 DUF6236 family protein [Vogesella indigofera]
MGEAKRRSSNDKFFGKIPKSIEMRGIVVSPPLEIDGTRLFARMSNLHPQELRFSLLFWDKLVWPSSRSIHFASGPDEIFLESAGILTRPDYTFDGDGATGIALGQIQAFIDFNEKNPGAWSLSQGEDSLLIKNGFSQISAGTSLELHRAIPIPKYDVPLAEILEFKHRRRDELLYFRHHLESLIPSLSNANRREDIDTAIQKIDAACADLVKVGREYQFPMYLSNLKANLSISPSKLVPSSLAGFAVGNSFGLTAASAAAGLAAIGSMIEIKADINFRSAKKEVSPFKYVYRIHNEL